MTLATVASVVGIGAGVASLAKSSSSNNASSPTNAWNPANLDAANAGWLGSFNEVGNINNSAYTGAEPGYAQSLQNAQNINYNPYLGAAQQAGQQYSDLGGLAQQQMGQYGQQAQLAGQQQQGLYGAGNAIMNRAMDPNMAQYNQSQQALQGQVNAGQAARGLGNSPVGGQEYNNAMGNFNTMWNTQQLQNEATGAQAQGALSNAGGAQGQLVGANLAGQLAAGQAGAGYTQQGGSVPMQAQQYVGQQPGVAAGAYQTGMQGLDQMYGQQAGLALPYITGGQGAQQFNVGQNTAQNAANAQLLTQSAGAFSNQATNPNSWLNQVFGSGSSATGGGYNPSGSSGSSNGGQMGGSTYGSVYV